MHAETLASNLTDRQVQLLAAVTLAMGGGETPALSYDEWCEAESLIEGLESQEAQ